MTGHRFPQIVCHRGANRVAPENTIPAAQAAFDLGAAYVEIDVRTSADGVLLVIHDATVDRTTDGHGAVAALTAAEVAALDAGAWFDPAFAQTRVPRLDQTLSHAKGKGGLYVEIKAADPTAVVTMVRDHGLLQDCFFWSGDPALLSRLHKLDVPVMIRRTDSADVTGAIAQVAPAVMEFEPREITAADLAACRANGVRVMAFYDGDDPAVFDQAIAAGIDLFNLDAIDVFQRVVRP